MFRPDSRWLTKQWLTLATLSVLLLVPALVGYLVGRGSVEDVGVFALALWLPVGGVIVVMWLVAVPLISVWYRNLSFEVGEDRVVVHKGILSRIEQNIPFRKVTDFRLHRSLYDRFLGLGSIDVQTAGQNQTATGYEARLAGLADWQSRHDEMLQRLREVQVLGLDQQAPLASGLDTLVADVHAIREFMESRV